MLLCPLVFHFEMLSSYSHLLFDSRSANRGWVGWVTMLIHHPPPSCIFQHFPPKCLTYSPPDSLSLSFSPSALPSLAMDLCWTSTSASAGEDSTIRAEWHSMALKVGYTSLRDIKILIAERCHIKTLNHQKQGFGIYIYIWKRKQPLCSWQPHILFEIPAVSLNGYPEACEVTKLQASVKGFQLFFLWKCLRCFHSEL